MTMDDPLFVGRVETSAILSSVRDRLGHGERPRGDPIGERLSLDGTSWSTVGRDEALNREYISCRKAGTRRLASGPIGLWRCGSHLNTTSR